MNLRTSLLRAVLGLGVLVVAASQLAAQGGPPWAGRGAGPGRGQAAGNPGRGPGRGPGWAGQGGPDAQFVADRDTFHGLLQDKDQIHREVKNTSQGVETLTESDQPEVAAKIQEHVAAMAKRVEERRPIHMRDPLFAEVFRNADKIRLKFEKTAKGVRVVETSDDPYTVKLIQAHGGVVSLFVKNGFAEARMNHEVPGAKGGAAAADGSAANAAGCPGAGCPLAAAGKCPAAAAGQCPGAVAGQCPRAAAGTCPASKDCPRAAAGTCPAGKDCPRAKDCPAGKNCPLGAQCPAGKACPGCPAAGACPLSGGEQAPPLPKSPEKPAAK